MRTVTRDIVSALIFSKDGKLFLGKKDPAHGGVYPDCWHIPGGGVDAGETKEQALVREIKEETGIDISTSDIALVDDSGKDTTEKTLKDTGEQVLCHMNFTVYKAILDTNAVDVNISLTDDLVEYMWVDVSQLGTLKLTPPSVELFRRLGL